MVHWRRRITKANQLSTKSSDKHYYKYKRRNYVLQFVLSRGY